MKDFMNGRVTVEVTNDETEKVSRINLGDLVENPDVDQLKAVKSAIINVSEDPVTQLTYTQSYLVI